MDVATVTVSRLPRFRRASEPPAFQLTDGDVEILRQLAKHRFLRSTHVAALVGRSLDRTNDRLSKLFHAAYVDRPRAQLDYYPNAGSAPFVYALADRGARLLIQRDGIEFANVEWSRKNRRAGRPFIDHQLEIVDFYLSLLRATKSRNDVRLIHPGMIVAAMPARNRAVRDPFAMRVKIPHQGSLHEIAVVPDFVFGLQLADGTRRNYVVEIDRGTMPIARASFAQTSFDRKMRAYLTAHAGKLYDRYFGWKTFRVLTVTTDDHRRRSMLDTVRKLRVPHSPGGSLFLFATRNKLIQSDPLAYTWADGNGRDAQLV